MKRLQQDMDNVRNQNNGIQSSVDQVYQAVRCMKTLVTTLTLCWFMLHVQIQRKMEQVHIPSNGKVCCVFCVNINSSSTVCSSEIMIVL